LRASGKTPETMLLLKICARGTQISELICLRSEVLMPSISVLDLFVKDLIMSVKSMGFMSSSSKGIVIGLFSIYDNGSLNV
jgi:hypothetical protein